MMRARSDGEDRRFQVLEGIPQERGTILPNDSTPLNDARYLGLVRRLMDAASEVVADEGYKLDGLVMLVELDGQGVTIASTLDSDDDTRRVLAEGIARSHNVTSRRFD